MKTVATDQGLQAIPIKSAQWTVRTRNCLEQEFGEAGTLLALATTRAPRLLAIKNFGKKSLYEVREVLSGYGRALLDEEPPDSLDPIQRQLRDIRVEGERLAAANQELRERVQVKNKELEATKNELRALKERSSRTLLLHDKVDAMRQELKSMEDKHDRLCDVIWPVVEFVHGLSRTAKRLVSMDTALTSKKVGTK